LNMWPPELAAAPKKCPSNKLTWREFFMATIICSSCGTRNPQGAQVCRRCEEVLAENLAPTELIAAVQPADSSLIAGRWEVKSHLPGSDNPYLFLGYDRQEERPVLVKRLSRAAALDRTVRGRFSKEADVLGALAHPGLARLLE